MTKKKSTTKGGPRGKDDEPLAEVAGNLAALLRDPATPGDLYNHLLTLFGDWETEYLNHLRQLPQEGAEHALRVLKFHAEGGVR